MIRRGAVSGSFACIGIFFLRRACTTECTALYGKIEQPPANFLIHTALRKLPVFISLARWQTGEKFKAVINVVNRVDLELSGFDRLDDIASQHQMFHICDWNQHPLVPAQSAFVANVKEPFYFLVNTTDCLNFSC